jgi:hypothetical protein
MNWRRLEQEISALLKSCGCTLERDAGEMWLTTLPEDEFACDDESDVGTTPISVSDLARVLGRIFTEERQS